MVPTRRWLFWRSDQSSIKDSRSSFTQVKQSRGCKRWATVVGIPRTSGSKWRIWGTRGPRAETGPAYEVIIFSTGRKRRGGKGAHRGGLSPARSKGTRVENRRGKGWTYSPLCLCKYARLLPRHTCTETESVYAAVCARSGGQRASERAGALARGAQLVFKRWKQKSTWKKR